MKKFYANRDNLEIGKFVVELSIVIYRAKLGKYPSFLSRFGTPDNERDGFTTKFCYIMNDENGNPYVSLTEEEATKIADTLEEKYRDIILECEDTGDWDSCPIDFDKLDLVFYK